MLIARMQELDGALRKTLAEMQQIRERTPP
jgi:hypothetical protein